MNRHAFRSLSSRARPELEQNSTILSSYFRTAFSTTSPLLESDGNTNNNSSRPQGSLKEKTRAVGARVSEMLKQRPAAAAKPKAAPGAAGKVLDVRVLPRGGLRGRGGFRGRGGAAATATGNRFSGANAQRGNVARGGARGARGARGGRGGRGGARRGGKAVDGAGFTEAGEEDKPKKPWRAREDDLGMDASQKEFDHVMRFGEQTVWTPEISAESLAPYMPSVPSSATAAARAAVLKNLSTLAEGTSADFAGQPEVQLSSNTAWEVRERGLRFFPDPAAKEETEASLQEWRTNMRALDETLKEKGEEPAYSKENVAHLRELVAADGPILKEAEESVKKAVLDRAVRGVHEKPVFAQDTPGLVRSWGLREGTYTDEERRKFESKVLGLLAKGQKGGAKAKPQPKAKAA